MHASTPLAAPAAGEQLDWPAGSPLELLKIEGSVHESRKFLSELQESRTVDRRSMK